MAFLVEALKELTLVLLNKELLLVYPFSLTAVVLEEAMGGRFSFDIQAFM